MNSLVLCAHILTKFVQNGLKMSSNSYHGRCFSSCVLHKRKLLIIPHMNVYFIKKSLRIQFTHFL